MRRRRTVALTVLALALALGYLAFFQSSYRDLVNAERYFGAREPAEGEAGQLGVYLTVLAVDTLNQTMRVRVDITPSQALRGQQQDMVRREVILHVDDFYQPHEQVLRAQVPIGPVNLDANLDGSAAAAYPLEAFRAALRVAAQEGGPAATAVPVRLTIWDGIAGWSLRTEEESAGAGEIRVRLQIFRTGAIAFLALALYAAMAMLAAAAIAMGTLVFLRLRRLDTTLAAILNGMLFALPAMRYALPGSPPLGVLADHLVFLWAELAVALGLGLCVLTWAIDGPRE